MKILSIVLLLCVALCDYNENDAKRYTWASSFAYCDKMGSNDCGKASASIKNLGLELVSYKQTGQVFNFINCAILKDTTRKEIIVSFSGTKNPA